jgi:hypothetical protein
MQKSFNCIICAQEFTNDELENVSISDINITDFKICQSCINISNPEDDYNEIRKIVGAYLINSNLDKILKDI